jgi:replicative DNA helicase
MKLLPAIMRGGETIVSLDLTLLKLMKHRSKFDRLIAGLPEAGLEETTNTLLADFKAYFKEFPDARKIDYQTFMLWFTEFRHNSFAPERTGMFEAIMKRAQDDVSPEVEEGLMERLVSAEASYRVLGIVEQWSGGAEFDLLTRLEEAVEDFGKAMDRKVRTPFVDDPIEDMLKEDEDDSGFHWRLDCLNTSMRPLRGGDFGIIAARPDKGKTTFLTSELSYMVSQIAKVGMGEVKPILWFNNEGPGKRIKQRYYQSLLGCSIPEMVAKLRAGTLNTELLEITGGIDPNMLLRIVDVHDARSHEIEQIIRSHPPSLVVMDMIDNISFSGLAANNGQRTDQMLEAMYQWSRNLAVKYDAPFLATSQISADGDGLTYPTLPMLKDSKTGKQGAADFIITLGALNDPAMDGYRFIGMTKNKLHRSGGRKDPRTEVIFDMERARYENADE